MMKAQSTFVRTKTPPPLSPPLAGWINWLDLTAGAISVIALAGLIALLAQSANAETPQPPKGGFQPGQRTFTNPFANTAPSKGGTAFDDDEEEEHPNPAQNAPTAGGPGAPPPPPATGNAQKQQGISMGGNTPGGVVSHTDVGSLNISAETGEGSKEIVTDFNFPDADIMDIAKTLGRLTGKNFILDKDVKGRITIISNSEITVGDAWRAFLTALDINGFALIPSGKYIRIARQRDARDKQLRTYTGEHSPDTDALITRVFPLKYINSEEVARTFRSFMPANSRIIPYDQTNTVIVTDTGSNIAKLSKMLEILDVEGYDAGIEVIPVKHASAVGLSKLIDTLIPGTRTAPGGAPGAPRFGGALSRFNARRTKEGGIINTIIADERTNTLIVHANTRGADQVRALVTKLDQKVPSQLGGGKVHVRYLQFADAEQIANTLNNLSGAAARPAAPAPGAGTGVNPVAASLFEGAIKISPDKSTNSLVITASPSDFVTVERVINRLDIPRDEVYVEVVIMEVTLAKTFDFSSNLISPVNGVALMPNTDLLQFIANPTSQRGALIGFKSQGTQTVNIGGKDFQVGNVQGLIKLLQTNSNANVLATPQIIALDNTEAAFESAEKIPVPTTTAVQGAGVATSITKEAVSLAIKLKPQINKITNFVKLDIETKLEDISTREVPAQVQGLAFATISRNAKTTVVVGDADTVVIGGLIRDKVQDTVSKIPILGDIPLLGWLFRAKSTATEKTNLLIFMTPHIVRQYEKVRAILDKKLQERDEYLERNAGGNDPLRYKRDEMIRSLPDLTELQAKKIPSTVTIDDEAPAPAQPSNPQSPFTAPATPESDTVAPAPVPKVPEESMPPAGTEITPPPPPTNN